MRHKVIFSPFYLIVSYVIITLLIKEKLYRLLMLVEVGSDVFDMFHEIFLQSATFKNAIDAQYHCEYDGED